MEVKKLITFYRHCLYLVQIFKIYIIGSWNNHLENWSIYLSFMQFVNKESKLWGHRDKYVRRRL